MRLIVLSFSVSYLFQGTFVVFKKKLRDQQSLLFTKRVKYNNAKTNNKPNTPSPIYISSRGLKKRNYIVKTNLLTNLVIFR